MAAKPPNFEFRAPMPNTLEPWRPELEAGDFDAVVRLLHLRDQDLEEYLTQAAFVNKEFCLSQVAGAGTLGGVTAAYVALPGSPTLPVIKKYSDTALRITMAITGYKTTNVGLVEFGLFDGTSTYKVGQFYFNELSVHHTLSATAHIMQGRKANNYNLLAVAQVAATEFNQDANDWVSFNVQEVYDT